MTTEERIADAIQERGRKAGSGEPLYFDRFNLVRVIREALGAEGVPALARQPEPQWMELLKRVIVAWDTDDNMEFLAATTAARKHLGLKLADEGEARDDAELLKANGYTENGESPSALANEAKE